MAYKNTELDAKTLSAFSGGPTCMPNNERAEIGVLAHIARNPDTLFTAELCTDHFYSMRHKLIFQAIRGLATRNGSVQVNDADVISFGMKSKDLNVMGGQEYIAGVLSDIKPASFIANGIQMLKDNSIQRKAIESANLFMTEIAGKSGDQIASLFNEAGKKIFKNHGMQGEENLEDSANKIIAEYDEFQRTGKTGGVMTGIGPVDAFLRGLKPCYWVIGAVSGAGKTATACCIFDSAIAQKNHALFFSQEMGADEILKRIVSKRAKINGRALLNGSLTKDEYKKAVDCTRKLVQDIKPFGHIYHDPRMTIGDIRAKCLAYIRKNGKLDWVLVDYIQNISAVVAKDSETKARVDEVTKELKALSKELNCVVIGLSQLTTEGLVEPTVFNIRDSGQIRQDADIITLISKTQDAKERDDFCNILKFNFAKGRSIGEDLCEVKFDPRYMTMDWVNRYIQSDSLTQEQWEAE